MTIDEMIEELEAIKRDHGGDLEVHIKRAYLGTYRQVHVGTDTEGEWFGTRYVYVQPR